MQTGPSIWRLNIKTAANEGIDPRKFCLDRKILGVGWPIDLGGIINWDSYYKNGAAIYHEQGDKGWWPAINAVKNRLQLNDLCWTRDKSGVYYLGRVVGEWEYRMTKEYLEADVVNVRECEWFQVGEVDAVPGKVINSFIRGRTLQIVDDGNVSLYSQYLYNSLSGSNYYLLPKMSADLFALVSSEDCEDIVGLFLQEKGYRMIPSSCKSDTAVYEFVMKHAETGASAVAQVKQGDVDLHFEDYSSLSCDVYLLTTHGRYVGMQPSNIHCIDPDILKEFITRKKRILSDRVKTWLSIIERLA
ncbi:MAG TPA: hypothetical protein VFX02_11455 [Gammaproteobacteria bacterium]|nr:hypothetical protein [Gammaproteobacteria bacterium]